jgi:hypothetical protein
MFLDIISEFLSSCPLFSGKNITQNYLSPSLSSVGIFQVAENPILKSYTDGGGLISKGLFAFVFIQNKTNKIIILIAFLVFFLQ